MKESKDRMAFITGAAGKVRSANSEIVEKAALLYQMV